jgi:glycosyltransferase involved in cell wall biosynthesis
MKILQISPEGNFGSVGTIAEQIGELIITNGYESYIAIGNYNLKSSSKIFKIGNFFNRIIHAIESRIFDNNGLGSRNSTNVLIKWIDQLNPDLIHIHQLHGYYINYKILLEYLRSKDIPLVLTLHDCWPFTGHCTYFESISCQKWKTQCYNCELLNDYPKSLFLDNSYDNFNFKKNLFTSYKNLTITTVSSWLADRVSESFLKNIPKQIIYNGVDTRVFHPVTIKNINTFNNYQNKFIILGVATPWTERKGLNDFIELSKILNKDAIIVLIGLSKNQMKLMPKNIVSLPKVNNKNILANHYRSANLFLNLSIAETFGLTTVEAMACGTPVVVYNATASPELISKGTGYIVDKHDILSINNIVNRLLNSEDLELNRVACVNWVKEKFTSKINYLEYLSLYKKILNK